MASTASAILDTAPGTFRAVLLNIRSSNWKLSR